MKNQSADDERKPGSETARDTARRYSIRLEASGERFECAETQNILRGMEGLGRRGIPVGCRGGGCGVCKIRVLSGEFRTRKMSRTCISQDEEAGGIVLACKTFPLSNLSLAVVGKMKFIATAES